MRQRGVAVTGPEFLALQRHCRTRAGYAALKHHAPEDSMPSFWLAETLKYLFLLFSDDSVLSRLSGGTERGPAAGRYAGRSRQQ